jgi:glycosyltransferase involved in cell wall biosynthesis
MINFIWSPGSRLPAGTGGTENYTVGQVRELISRGIEAQIITIGLGIHDGREEFIDIPFKSLESETEIEKLDGKIIFINDETGTTKTIEQSYSIMHIPPPLRSAAKPAMLRALEGRILITPSRYAAQLWADYIPRARADIHVAYPFAEPCFAVQKRVRNNTSQIRVLFAGRLSAEKGIYTFLEALHRDTLNTNPNLVFTVTTAGADKPEGALIKQLLDAHPNVTVINARKTPATMAELMAVQDIVVMPSNSQYWHETFGIVSIEAQHSGCWVVASNDGGLPETNCGGVILVEPDDPEALAQGVATAIANGPLPDVVRQRAGNLYTVEQSVDSLLKILYPQEELVVKPIDKLMLKTSNKVNYDAG